LEPDNVSPWNAAVGRLRYVRDNPKPVTMPWARKNCQYSLQREVIINPNDEKKVAAINSHRGPNISNKGPMTIPFGLDRIRT
jgi:hypothetical protein